MVIIFQLYWIWRKQWKGGNE